MKKHRKIAGLSQEKLARLCDASHSYIRQMECGSKFPSFSFLGTLASALNIPVADLFVDENDEKNYGARRKEKVEAELVKDLAEAVHSALSRL
jgi:transcriptional regulator with XRE-family HTH domain